MAVDVAQQTKTVVDLALSKCGDISTLPEVTAKIIELVEDANSTARDMHEIIKTDPALSARVLKVVNSPFYGLPGQVASVDRAIVLLGLSAVKNIAIAASISRMFRGEQLGAQFTARDLWRHSVAVAVGGRLIAKATKFRGPIDEVFLAGLIHDLGLMVERQAFPDKLAEVVEQCTSGGGHFLELETKIVGADHQAFGDGLATKWKFPRNLRAVVGMHHTPERLSTELQMFGSIVRTADVLVCDLKLGFHLTVGDGGLTDELLESTGLCRDQITQLSDELQEGLEDAESNLSSSV